MHGSAILSIRQTSNICRLRFSSVCLSVEYSAETGNNYLAGDHVRDHLLAGDQYITHGKSEGEEEK